MPARPHAPHPARPPAEFGPSPQGGGKSPRPADPRRDPGRPAAGLQRDGRGVLALGVLAGHRRGRRPLRRHLRRRGRGAHRAGGARPAGLRRHDAVLGGAVSSPQMYAPAPRCRTIVTPPSSPASRTSSSAARSTSNSCQVLAADVDEDVLRLDRVRRDQAALDQPVRDAEHDLAVLERRPARTRRRSRPGRSACPCPSRGSSPCGPWGSPRRPGRAGSTASELLDDRLRAPCRGPSRAPRSRRSSRYSASCVRSRSSAPREHDSALTAPRTSSTIGGHVLGLDGSR